MSLLGCSLGQLDPVEEQAQRDGLERWRLAIKEAGDLPPEEAIPLLGSCVRKMNRESLYQIEERWEVLAEAQNALISIPGHAEYYGRRLKKGRDRYEEALASGIPGAAGPPLVTLHNMQMEAQDVLSQLPSAETVRVLGELLYDERGRRTQPRAPGEEFTGEVPNFAPALGALKRLPLVNNPGASEAPGMLETYRLWYEQIKAGNRTFRFEGDPHEYSLDGPVATIAVSTERPSRAARQSVANPEEEPQAETGPPIGVVIVASVILLLSALFFFRGRHSRDGTRSH
jgi:hypothetical protein